VAYRRWLDITPQVGHWFTDSRREWLYGFSRFFWFSEDFFTERIVVFVGLIEDAICNFGEFIVIGLLRSW
jgi:hypothetical protein